MNNTKIMEEAYNCIEFLQAQVIAWQIQALGEAKHKGEWYQQSMGTLNKIEKELKASNESLTIEDYEECLADKRRLVRKIDVIINGENGAAKQASLCDLIPDIEKLVRLRDNEKQTALAQMSAMADGLGDIFDE